MWVCRNRHCVDQNYDFPDRICSWRNFPFRLAFNLYWNLKLIIVGNGKQTYVSVKEPDLDSHLSDQVNKKLVVYHL